MEAKIINGGLSVDDRGSVTFVNDFDFTDIKRFYMVENHRAGFIRAWHGHEKEAKYVFVVSGSALIGAVKMNEDSPKKFILSSKSPKILYIPPGYANGFKTLEEGTKVIFYSTSTLKESINDDVRYSYDKWNIWEEDYR